MKKTIALLLITSFIVVNCATYERGEGINLEPGQKPGAIVIIQKIEGVEIKGELIAVKENSLLLKEQDSGADESVVVGKIKTITITKKSKVLLGCGLGLLIGGAIGAMATSPEAQEASEPMVAAMEAVGEGFTKGFIVICAGLFGSMIGGFIGKEVGTNKTIHIEGMPPATIEHYLEDLRKKARVPDFQ
jgi:hypothetical protein